MNIISKRIKDWLFGNKPPKNESVDVDDDPDLPIMERARRAKLKYAHLKICPKCSSERLGPAGPAGRQCQACGIVVRG